MRKLKLGTEKDVEMAKLAASLILSVAEVKQELDASPCIYRGCEIFAWCENCKGWRPGCTARRPDRLYQNADGTWLDSDP